MVSFNQSTWTLTDHAGTIHQVFPQEFWYLAPNVVDPDHNSRPLDLAMTLHNARQGAGLCIAMETLLKDLPPSSAKSGRAKEAEDLFEDIRQSYYPERPSRLRCFFLSLDEATAREREQSWSWGVRRLVRCHLVLSSGRYHYADVREYEQAARHGPTVDHAHAYWGNYDETRVPKGVTEVLADSDLYFPDWATFPTLDRKKLAIWEEDRARRQKAPGRSTAATDRDR